MSKAFTKESEPEEVEIDEAAALPAGVKNYITPAGMAQPIATMATFHPAYLLRQPAAKREVWRDLLAIQEKLRELGE